MNIGTWQCGYCGIGLTGRPGTTRVYGLGRDIVETLKTKPLRPEVCDTCYRTKVAPQLKANARQERITRDSCLKELERYLEYRTEQAVGDNAEDNNLRIKAKSALRSLKKYIKDFNKPVNLVGR